jgi:hypothetical protein
MTTSAKTFIENHGFTETFIDRDGKKNQNRINWNVKYDGSNADINFGINDNGKYNKIHTVLSNENIIKLLEIQPDPISLDQRLKNDFLKPTPLFISKVKQKKRTIHKKKNTRQKTKKRSTARFLRNFV